MTYKKGSFHILLASIGGCLAIRLFPVHIPSIEPLMVFYLPLQKRCGVLSSFIFAASSIILFDAITCRIGLWTITGMLAYGSLGLIIRRLFKIKSFLFQSIIGTLWFDLVTGVCTGPLLFNQPFFDALIGQIPFTLLHLIGNGILTIVISPLIDHSIVTHVCNQTRGDFLLSGKKVL